MDDVDNKKKEIERTNPELRGDIELLLTLESLIKTVDGQTLTSVQLDAFVRRLPMMDANTILKAADKRKRK
jgi:hypothetical protein